MTYHPFDFFFFVSLIIVDLIESRDFNSQLFCIKSNNFNFDHIISYNKRKILIIY